MGKIIKFGEKEYTLEFANKVTMKSKALQKLIDAENIINDAEAFVNRIDEYYFIMADLILIGLQKYHRDDFGCDFDTMEGYETSSEKVHDMLETYFKDEDADFIELFTAIQEELMANGFLASMFRKMKMLAEQVEKENKKSKK